MNVIHLSCWFPLPEKPSYGQFIKQQIKAQYQHADGNTHVVAAVVVGPGKQSYAARLIHLDPKTDGMRGAILEVTTRFWKMLYNNPPFLLQQFRQLYRHIADGLNPDLIHAHISYPCGVVARQMARQFDLPYIISDHWLALKNHLQAHPLKHMTFKAMVGAQSLIVPTTFMKQELQEVSLRHKLPPIHIVPPAIDASIFSFKPKQQHNHLHLVALANLQRSKKLELLIDAVAKLEEQDIPIRLSIIGSGTHQKALEARTLDHHAPVRFIGRQTRKQIATHLHDADAALFSSNYETYGPGMAEALSTGTPIIANNLPVWQDVVSPGFGQLVEPSVEAWINAIASLRTRKFEHAKIADFAAFRYAPAAVAEALATIQQEAVQ